MFDVSIIYQSIRSYRWWKELLDIGKSIIYLMMLFTNEMFVISLIFYFTYLILNNTKILDYVNPFN